MVKREKKIGRGSIRGRCRKAACKRSRVRTHVHSNLENPYGGQGCSAQVKNESKKSAIEDEVFFLSLFGVEMLRNHHVTDH